MDVMARLFSCAIEGCYGKKLCSEASRYLSHSLYLLYIFHKSLTFTSFHQSLLLDELFRIFRSGFPIYFIKKPLLSGACAIANTVWWGATDFGKNFPWIAMKCSMLADWVDECGTVTNSLWWYSGVDTSFIMLCERELLANFHHTASKLPLRIRIKNLKKY